jgi:phage terminase large subunit-like protein
VTDLVERILANPDAAWRALDLADARDSLADFCGMVEIPGVEIDEAEGRFLPIPDAHLGDHHRYLIERLEAVERGEVRRLMIFMPPGAAKSTYSVHLFTPWYLGRKPNRSVIVATYAGSLAEKHGRKARAVMRQPVYQEIFNSGLDPQRKAVAEWGTTNGGEWMGVGILGGVTGNRADLIIIDDPVKGRQEADSEVTRATTRQAYDDDVLTRQKSGAAIIIIQTRWHEADLSGSLLPEDYDGESGPILCRDGETWEVVNIPAQAERDDDPLGRKRGEFLWPEYWPREHWNQFMVNPRTWSALYQQRPRPDEGTYFERSSFKRFTDVNLPKSLRYYGTSDYAVSEGRGDYTVLTVWGVDAQMNIYRVASWRGQTSTDIWVAAQCDLIAEFRGKNGGIRKFLGEKGVIQKAIEPALAAELRTRRLTCSLEWLPSINDKTSRARSSQGMVREGRVWVRDDSDGDCFIDECVGFPAGKYDDEVDNLSLMGRFMDQVTVPRDYGRREEYADGMAGIDD